jgi:hypothetical protein
MNARFLRAFILQFSRLNRENCAVTFDKAIVHGYRQEGWLICHYHGRWAGILPEGDRGCGLIVLARDMCDA